jgi:hypothetical protein
MEDSKKIIFIISAIISVAIISITYAFFNGQGGYYLSIPYNASSGGTDVFKFSTNNDLTLSADTTNFNLGNGNLVSEVTPSATLIANTSNSSASNTYQLYLNITSNTFIYTKNSSTPELILTITDPNNNTITSLGNLNYVASGGVSGFDITTYSGLLQIASNYAISSTNTTTGVTQTWHIKVTYINLATDQIANEGKEINAKVIIQKEALS